MHKRFRSSDLNGPSRRELFLLAASVASAAVAGAPAADAQATSFVVPPATEAVSPFRISLPQTAIDDLRHRLASTRYPERETVGDWTQGVPLDKARVLIEYWRDRYDWRRFEARANSVPHFRTRIDGLGIHFIHARSSHANALPIVLRTGGLALSWNSWKSLVRLPNQRCLVGVLTMHSMSSFLRFQVLRFQISLPKPVGTWSALQKRG